MSARIAIILTFMIGAIRGCSVPAPITASSAAMLRESIGTNLHLEYDETPYAGERRTLEALQKLGIRHVRDAAMRSGPARERRFAVLARAGIRFDLFVNRDLAAQLASVHRLVDMVPGSVELIEGPNEANHEPFGDHVGGDAPAVQAFQRRLNTAVKETASFSSIPVANFTYWPPLEGQADLANFHAYPSLKRSPSTQLAWMRTMAAAVQSRDSPIVCTETGFPTAGVAAVSEEQQAALTLVVLLENFRAHVQRTYLYELFDERSEAIAARPDRENHFGLFKWDGSPKPVAISIARFMQVLAEPAGSKRKAFSRAIWLSGRGLRTLEVTRADGARITFAWWSNAQNVADRVLETRVPPGYEVQTLNLVSGEVSQLKPGAAALTVGASPVAIIQSSSSVREAAR